MAIVPEIYKSSFLHDPGKDELFLLRATNFCAAMVLVLSLGVLAVWVFKADALAGARTNSLLMAPSTALCFSILSFCLLFCLRRKPPVSINIVIKFIVSLVIALALTILLQFFGILSFDIEKFIIPLPYGFGTIVPRRMSPFTAGNLFLIGMAFWFLSISSKNDRRSGKIISGLSSFVIFFGFAVVMVYIHEAPIFYINTVLPMALLTAFGFILLGSGLIFATGIYSWPLRLFIGDSMRSRMMRALSPVIFCLGLFYALIHQVIFKYLPQPSLLMTLLAILFMLVIFFTISFIAKRVGLEIDRIASERKVAWEAQMAFKITSEHAVQLLRQEHDRAQTYLNMVGSMIVVLDQRGVVILINKIGCEILGYDESEIIGRNWFDHFIPERNREEVKKVFSDIVLGNLVSQEYYENPVLTKDGTERIVAWHNTYLKDVSGNVSSVLSAGEDITERRSAEDSLRSSQLLLNCIVEGGTDAIYVKDLQGRYLLFNKSATGITGKSSQEVIGQDDTFLFSLDEARVVMEGDRKVMEFGQVMTYEEVVTSHKGEKRYFLSTKGPIFDAHGKVSGIFGIARDITDMKFTELSLRESEMRFRQLFDKAPVSYQSLDINGCFIDVNSTWLEKMGYLKEEVIGRWFGDFLAPEQKEVFGERFPCFKSLGMVCGVEFVMVPKDGQCFTASFEGRVGYAENGNFKQTHCIFIDISERKRLEEQLSKYRQNLEDLVTERTKKLEIANKELEAFSYTVSHDLRVPLRAIDGFSKAILDDCSDNLNDEAKRLFGVIRNNIKKMGQLIDGLLDFFHLSHSPINKVNFDMDKMLAAVWEEVLGPFDKARIKMIALPLPAVISDPRLIHQIMINLLSNAVKFSLPKDNPVIEIGAQVKENENIYYIKDNGVGFDMQYADKLFKAFQRLHSSDKFEGTGVGLAIVKRIIERLGGRVWAEAQLNEGATFYFALPVKRG